MRKHLRIFGLTRDVYAWGKGICSYMIDLKMLNRWVKFSLDLCEHEKKIKIIMHAFCDKEDINAQNLNAREIAYRLDPDLFEVTLFYRRHPDERLFWQKIFI